MENKKEMTTPNVSAATDTEQPFPKCTDHSIADCDENIKGFEEMQKEMLRRSSARPHTNCVGTTLHEFTGKILCGKCGCKYRRKKLVSGKVVWICPTFNRLGKAYCASQQIPDAILRDLVSGIAFDHIRVPYANTVTIITKSGEEITRTWENPSRSESWTPEMREKARQRSIIHGKKRSNDYSGD